MNKDVEIRCRVSKEEKSLITKKAKQAGMKLSEYVRIMSLSNTEVEVIINTKIITK